VPRRGLMSREPPVGWIREVVLDAPDPLGPRPLLVRTARRHAGGVVPRLGHPGAIPSASSSA